MYVCSLCHRIIFCGRKDVVCVCVCVLRKKSTVDILFRSVRRVKDGRPGKNSYCALHKYGQRDS